MSILLLIFVIIIYLYYARQYKIYKDYNKKPWPEEIKYPHIDDPFHKDGHDKL